MKHFRKKFVFVLIKCEKNVEEIFVLMKRGLSLNLLWQKFDVELLIAERLGINVVAFTSVMW